MNWTNWYSVSKAMHLIGMVSWMAGLFYLVRLFVYHAEATQKSETERGVLMRQYAIMEGRVNKIIIKPALVITWTFGSMMLAIQPIWLEQPWMWAKLGMLLILTAYTVYCGRHIRYLVQDPQQFSSVYYRAMNEVPTIILVTIVFLAVFRSAINWWYLLLGILLFAGLIFSAIRRLAKKQAEANINS